MLCMLSKKNQQTTFQSSLSYFPQKIDFDMTGDNLLEMSNPIFFWKRKEKNISNCRLLNVLPSMLSVKEHIHC